MEFKTVNLGHDYTARIQDFSQARNSFLHPPDDEYGPEPRWVLFLSDDEEPSRMLLDHLAILEPTFPYYWIRRYNLVEGRFVSWANPDYQPHLVSNRVRFVGRIHEHVEPRKPHGMIDYPIIHDHAAHWDYDGGWKATHAYRLVQATKHAVNVLRGR